MLYIIIMSGELKSYLDKLLFLPICRYNCLVIVDSVASFAGVPLHVDDLGLDVVYSCSQKGLSCPPGASPITLSPRAW